MATSDTRAHAVALMNFFLSKKPQINYLQVRPMGVVNNYPYEQNLVDHLSAGGTIGLDCSESTTLICKYAGFQDPNGFNYNGNGNTLTMYDHLQHYTNPAHALAGAIVIFGAPSQPLSNQHVAMVMSPGPDPVLFSHGSLAGPIQLKLSDYQTAVPTQTPTTFLNVGDL